MKKLLLSLAATALLICNHFAYAATNTKTDPKEIVDKTVFELMQKYNIPGVAVELYVNGKPYAYNYGYEQITKATSINDKTIFELGSITKLFTNLLLAMQVSAGKMQLDAPLGNYLLDFQNQDDAIKKVTLENLATYTSSLPFNVPDTITTREDLVKFLAAWKPSTAVGTTWQYSNLSPGLIGEALEMVTHENYDQLFRGRILQPLGMQPIGINVPDDSESHYAQGYNEAGEPVPKADYSLLPASGALKASAHDMHIFLKAALGLSGTPAAIRHAMQVAQTPYVALPNSQQGLGWEIHTHNAQTKDELLNDPEQKNLGPLPAQQLSKDKQIFNGDALIDKTGATYGFRAYIAVIPNKKSGIVILTNKYIPNGVIVNAGRNILLTLSSPGA